MHRPEDNENNQEAIVTAKHVESIHEKIANAKKNVDAMKIRNVSVGQTRLHLSKSVTITEKIPMMGGSARKALRRME